MKNDTLNMFLGMSLLNLCFSVALTLSDDRWRHYVPGHILGGVVSCLFVLWILKQHKRKRD